MWWLYDVVCWLVMKCCVVIVCVVVDEILWVGWFVIVLVG